MKHILNDISRSEIVKAIHEVPESMQVLYDYLHDRQIRWASKIKAKQEQYK